MAMKSSSPTDPRFLAKVDRSGECWLWTAATDPNGYGRFFFNGRMVLAHRHSYERYVGPIPGGVGLDHSCRIPGCVRPDHLRPATQKQNMENLAARTGSSSGVRGVSWNARRNLWHARVQQDGRLFHVGYFEDVQQAARAVKAKRNELFTHNTEDH